MTGKFGAPLVHLRQGGHNASELVGKSSGGEVATERASWRWGMVFVGAIWVGCASGPVELLEELGADEEASCGRSSACLADGLERAERGRFDEALPYLVEACGGGEVMGCLQLGHIYALGATATPRVEAAQALYEWGCFEARDGASCHALGELRRLEIGEGDESAVELFSSACELGEIAGCHDEAVQWLESDEVSEEQEEAAAKVFGEACDEKWPVACMNVAYMQASGRGVARDHRQAQRLFEEVCGMQESGWSAHRLAGLVEVKERDVYSVTEYHPERACEQLEVLLVGRVEERIISSFDAERDDLRRCYDAARPPDEETLGRMVLGIGVTAQGEGVSPQILDDEIGLSGLRECVEASLARHLDDKSGEEAVYRTAWTISFVHPPPASDEAVQKTRAAATCDGEAVQMALSQAYSELQRCGAEHTERHRDDPGAVMVRWSVGSTGGVEEVAMTTTMRQSGVSDCLESVIRTMEFDGGVGEGCAVQVPFSFSHGERLHFSVVGGR